MSRDFPLLMDHLRKRSAEVDLDVPSVQRSGDEVSAARFAGAQQAAIRRGDRVARLFEIDIFEMENGDERRIRLTDGSEPRPSLTTSITASECRRLFAAGARWVGPSEYAPVSKSFIESIRVRNFRCIQEVSFPLTPLHALIGPNDSGKSTLLDAIRMFTIGRSSEDKTSEETVFSGEQALTCFPAGIIDHQPHVTLKDALDAVRRFPSRKFVTRIGSDLIEPTNKEMLALVTPARVLRLDPDAMRQPTSLIAQGSPIEYSPRGEGLAAVYDALLSRRIDIFLEISKRFTTLFPTTRSIQLTNPTQTTKALGVELRDGRSIGAEQLSEGMLYWLAFAALPYLHPAPIILIEEPENGLHPSRIADVMRVLRDISNTSQIIIATHHPLVINELQPDEVTLLTRTPEQGTVATPLSSTKNFEQRSKVYALGELWLNYADGEFERDLVADSTIRSSVAG